MYPESLLVNDTLNIISTLLLALGGLVAIYIFLIFLPLFVRIMLEMIISIVRSQLRFDIRPILDLLFFPGSMLRVTIMWYTLSLFGFKYRLAFFLPDGGESASNINQRYKGLSYISYQENVSKENKTSHLKMAFVLSMASYQVLTIVTILLIFRSSILLSMYFFLPVNLVLPLFNFSIITLVFGGMPVPEETLAVLYGFIYTAPHLILALFISIIATLIIAPYTGVGLALFLLALSTVINVYTSKILGSNDPASKSAFPEINNYLHADGAE